MKSAIKMYIIIIIVTMTMSISACVRVCVRARLNHNFFSEIVKVIIRSSSSAQELLQRQRVRKDILKEYLISRSVIPLSTATKPELVQKVLDYWSSLSKHEVQNGVINSCHFFEA